MATATSSGAATPRPRSSPPSTDWLDRRQPGPEVVSKRGLAPVFEVPVPLLETTSQTAARASAEPAGRRGRWATSSRSRPRAHPAPPAGRSRRRPALTRSGRPRAAPGRRRGRPPDAPPDGVASSLIRPEPRHRPVAADGDLLVQLAAQGHLVGVERRLPSASASSTCPPTPIDRFRCSRASPCEDPLV